MIAAKAGKGGNSMFDVVSNSSLCLFLMNLGERMRSARPKCIKRGRRFFLVCFPRLTRRRPREEGGRKDRIPNTKAGKHKKIAEAARKPPRCPPLSTFWLCPFPTTLSAILTHLALCLQYFKIIRETAFIHNLCDPAVASS